MIIGEAPGAEEDRRGEPFVGRAGKLLDEMLRAIGLQRDEVFIANVLKCRPPNNRDPSVEEARLCRDHLQAQIELLNPRIVLAVGRIAAQQLLHTDAPLGKLRGQVHSLNNGQLPLVVTYHPAYLLRSPSQKRKVWADLCRARQLVTRPDS
jgi:DNA polymerase